VDPGSRLSYHRSKKEYEVEKILDHQGEGPQTKYFAKWKGYGDDENTWESLSNLTMSGAVRLPRPILQGMQ
jgi:hypothetical protein